MRELRVILDRQLSHLEAEKESIEGGIQEINRRLAVLDEVEGWNLLTEPDSAAPEADSMEFDSEEGMNGSSPLIRYSREWTAGL
ncbi:MAG: hypothetical protein IH870_10655 [Chloroflexi bacterium]|nr:hypothetical protein [Chloroflexota bacterium]